MIAHMFRDNGKLRYSGYNACGDEFDGAGDRRRREMKPRPFDVIVDVGREFHLTEEGELYLFSPGPAQHSLWKPAALYLAAREGWFGFKLLKG